MNNRQLYLAWLRTAAPTVYTAAIRKATGQKKNLGGLDNDLLQQALSPSLSHSFLGDDGSDLDTTFSASDLLDTSPITFDPIVFTPPAFDPGTIDMPSPVAIDSGSLPTANIPSSASTSSNIFTSVLQAVTSIGSTVVNASQQNALIALNTQRAAQGLPPVNAQGQVVTAAGTATTSAAMLAFENAIAGGSGGSSMLPLLLIGGLAFYFLFGRNNRPSAA